MKTKNEKVQNFIRGLFFGLVIAVLAVLIVGCGKDKAKNNNGYYNGYGGGYGYGYGNGYGGTGYNGGQISQVSAGVDSNGQFLLILATSSDPSTGGTGPGYVEGELRLFAPMPCLSMSMGLNPGLYQLIPPSNSPNTYSAGMLQNVQMIARGPGGEALVTVPYASIFQTNVCGYTGMMGSIVVQSVNGVACGKQLFFTDQVYNPGMCN